MKILRVLALLFFFCSPFCFAQSPFDASAVVRKSSPAVVLITGKGESRSSQGTGFIVSPDGKIVTSLHVIRNFIDGAVRLPSGETYDRFSVLAFDERRDLAIIKIAGFQLPTAELGNSSEASPGEPVVIIGNPMGLEGTVTAGVLSAVRDLPEGFRILQTDAPANPGNSGGPLINARGQVIGVVGFKLRDAEGLNFAVPINQVQGLLADPGPPMTLEAMRLRLGVTRDEEGREAGEGFPARWKSLTTGTTRSLRIDGDRIYIETLLPEQARAVGNMIMGEVQKAGDKYVGIIRQRIVCQYYRDYYMKWETNQCAFEAPIELTSVKPNRIEGRVFAPPDGSKFKCNKCAFEKKSAWQSFVWIPE
jgi:hypothetical protein